MNTSPLNQLMFRASPKARLPQTAPAKNRLTLYDRYSPLAYGIILRIVPQPELAQQVLVELFSSAELPLETEPSKALAVTIVRLARQKALAARPSSASTEPFPTVPQPLTDESLPKLVFDLTFRRGHTLGVVADRLQMTYEDVLQAIRTYVHSLRNR